MNSLIIVTTLCVVLIIATAALLAYVIADRRIIAQPESRQIHRLAALIGNLHPVMRLPVFIGQ